MDISNEDVITGVAEPEEGLSVRKAADGTGQKKLAPAF